MVKIDTGNTVKITSSPRLKQTPGGYHSIYWHTLTDSVMWGEIYPPTPMLEQVNELFTQVPAWYRTLIKSFQTLNVLNKVKHIKFADIAWDWEQNRLISQQVNIIKAIRYIEIIKQANEEQKLVAPHAYDVHLDVTPKEILNSIAYANLDT